MGGLRPLAAPIIEEEAKRHGLTVERLLTPIRLRERVRMRQYCMWRIRTETGRSFTEIARLFDCDHTTVMYGCRVIEAIAPEDRAKIPEVHRPQPMQPAKMFLGKPCRHGHIGVRYEVGGKCVECNRIRDKTRKQNEQKKKASPFRFHCTQEPQEDRRSNAAGVG